MRAIDAASVRAYLDRDWRRVRAAKRAYWRERLDRGGLAEALAVTDQLRAAMRERAGAAAFDQDREEDLETHRRVAAMLARTAPASPRTEAPAARGRARRIRAR